MERKPAEEFMVQKLSSVSIDSLDDGVDKEAVCGLGNRKNQLFLEHLLQGDVRVYETSVALNRGKRKFSFDLGHVCPRRSAGSRNIYRVFFNRLHKC